MLFMIIKMITNRQGCHNPIKHAFFALECLYQQYLPISICPKVLDSRITYQTISELTFFMKVIQKFVVNNFYIIHFNDKVCWTSQILGENSWKIVTFFCCEFCFRRRRRGADDQCIKTNNKMSHFFQEFSPRICEVQQTLSLKWII